MPISYSSSLTASVAASPTPAITASNPHTFRSLRSLLPFGPSKNAHASQSPPPQGTTARAAFSAFGSVRKSLTRERERKTSLTNLLPVISIDRPPANQSFEEGHMQRASIDVTTTDRLLLNEFGVLSRHSISETVPMLRSISPGPPLSADLSTIIEADSSCASKTDTQPSKPSSPAPDVLRQDLPLPTSEPQTDASLDLSTNQIAKEVYKAIMEKDVVTAEEWMNAEQPIIIDTDTDDDIPSAQLRVDNRSINIENVDPSIVALLTPNNLPKGSNQVTSRPQTGSSVASNTESNPLSSKSPLPLNGGPQSRRTTPTSSSIPRLRTIVHEPSTPGSSSPDTTFRASITPISSIQRARSDVTRRRIGSSSPLSNTSTPETRIPVNTGSAPAPLRQHRTYGHSMSASLSISSAPPTSSSTTPSVGISPRIPSLSSRLQANSASETHLKLSKSRTPSPTITPRHSLQALPGSSTASSSALISTTPNTPNTPNSIIRHVTSISRQNSESSSIIRHPNEFYGDTTSYGRASLDSGRSQILAPKSDSHILVTSTPFRRSSDGAPVRPRSLSSETATSPTSTRSHAQTQIREGHLTAGDAMPPSSNAIARRDDRPLSPSSRAGSSLRPAFSAPFRSRKRSMSVQDSHKTLLGRRPDSVLLHHKLNGASRSNSSLSGRLTNGRERDIREEGDEPRRPPQHDWLGPRSVKALRAAGLLSNDDRDRDHGEQDKQLARSSRERSGSVATSSGSGRTSLGGFGGLGRFVPSAARSNGSEYSLQNGRAQSRMAFSDAGGGHSSVSIATSSRRGSETFSHPYLMHSPTLTTSTSGSRDRESRDTPWSASTAPTSVSSTSLAYMSRERDRERDRDEIRELKEKHSTETGALLGALSDSQRTTRSLREENADIRERLERMGDLEAENEDLRREVRGLRREINELKVQLLTGSGGRGSRNGWLGMGAETIILGRRSGPNTPVEGRQEWLPQSNLDHRSKADDTEIVPPKDALRAPVWNRVQDFTPETTSRPPGIPVGPEATRHHRRCPSEASSIFPVLPSNMSMLMHEDNALLNDQGSNTGSSPANDHPLEQTSGSKPVPFRKPGGQNGITAGAANRSNVRVSMTSTTSISPTTANFSIMTGSPGSLFLRPEHEVHLGDMETFSLDLGTGRPDDLGGPNDW